jgi:hypothetical protein
MALHGAEGNADGRRDLVVRTPARQREFENPPLFGPALLQCALRAAHVVVELGLRRGRRLGNLFRLDQQFLGRPAAEPAPVGSTGSGSAATTAPPATST